MTQMHLNHRLCKFGVGANLLSLLLKVTNNTREGRQQMTTVKQLMLLNTEQQT